MKKIFALILVSLLLTSYCLLAQSNNITNKNIIYVSPVPNSRMNSSLTNIIIRSENKLDKQTIGNDGIIVTGSKSGLHNGNSILGDDGRTIIFNPYQKFSYGEVVSICLKEGPVDMSGNQIGEYNFDFTVSSQNLNTEQDVKTQFQNEIEGININKSRFNPSTEGLRKINKTELDLPADFPQLSIPVQANLSPGYIFISNISNADFITDPQNQIVHYLMILYNNGRPFYYKKMNKFCLDFKLQQNGLLTYYDSDYFRFYAMDSQFQVVDSFYCGNGYQIDFHELQLLPNGHYLILGLDRERVDMSKIVPGGDTSATVTGSIIQEIDENRNVVFQWRSWDHFKITDATDDIDLTSSTIDYVHTNAIQLDNDGNILISSRHLDEVTKINRQTGDIIWRLGGKNNQFQFINDSIGFSHQHDIRRLPNGDISLFDDGNLHWSQLPSRAAEYKLDEQNLTAQLVWQFINTPDEYSAAMGDAQRLSDGNTIIGWGTGAPAVTEVTPQGSKVFELFLPDGSMNYRAFRFKLDTSFYQSLVPSLSFPLNDSQIPDTMITLKWNRNKFAQFFHLQLAKDSAFVNIIYQDSNLVDTFVEFDSLEGGISYYWRVLSNNNTDSVGGYAGYSSPFTFTTLVNGPKNFNVETTSYANYLEWVNNTSNADSVIIERKGGSDTLNYKVIATVSGVTNSFVDKNPDAINVVSNLYTYRIKSVNRNVASNYTYSSGINWDAPIYTGNGYKPKTYSLEYNYPNPFNPSTYIVYDIPTDGLVVLKVYDVLGREVKTLVNEYKKAGRYKVRFSGKNLASGIYIYNLTSRDFSQTRKMALEK